MKDIQKPEPDTELFERPEMAMPKPFAVSYFPGRRIELSDMFTWRSAGLSSSFAMRTLVRECEGNFSKHGEAMRGFNLYDSQGEIVMHVVLGKMCWATRFPDDEGKLMTATMAMRVNSLLKLEAPAIAALKAQWEGPLQ